MACFLPLLTCYSAKDEIEFNGGQQDVGSNFLRAASWDFRDNRTADVRRKAQETSGNTGRCIASWQVPFVLATAAACLTAGVTWPILRASRFIVFTRPLSMLDGV